MNEWITLGIVSGFGLVTLIITEYYIWKRRNNQK